MRTALLTAFSIVVFNVVNAQISGTTVVIEETVTTKPTRNIEVVTSYTIKAPATGSITISAATDGSWYARVVPQTDNAPPDFSQNFVRTESAMVPVTNETDFSSFGADKIMTSYSYSDGLGRPTLSVAAESSPNYRDIVQPYVYDGTTGKQTLNYLPYTKSYSNPGGFRSNAIAEQAAFYTSEPNVVADSKPFAITEFDAAGRVKSITGSGNAWHANNKKASVNYYINTTTDAIKKWTIVSGLPVGNINYPANTLAISESINEQGIKSQSIADSRGRNVASRLWDGSKWLTSYQVYDDMGRIRFIIPPKLTSNQPTVAELNELASQYQYDERGRLIHQRGPGEQDWSSIVYDKWDRPIYTQDPEQKTAGYWIFQKYDQQNRVIMTGKLISTSTQATLANAAKTSTAARNENKSTTNSIGYTTNLSLPTSFTGGTSNLLTVTYYDGYHFLYANTGFTSNYYYNKPPDIQGPATANTAVKGLTTGSMVKIINTNGLLGAWLKSVVYYDNDYQVIQAITQNHMSGKETMSTQYNWKGEVLKTQLDHTGLESVSIVNEFEYDRHGRLINTWQTTGGGTRTLVANYTYNELGQLIAKKLHSVNNGSSFLQTLDYTFNIRGWNKTINNPASLGSDIWSAKYYYEDAPATIGGTSITKRYDGNLTAMEWNATNQVDNSLKRTIWGYRYNAENQLTLAKYAQGNGSTWSTASGHFDENITYDDQGNINTLTRKQANTLIDNLTYAYTGNGNILENVTDATNNAAGFKPGSVPASPKYEYDKNGNLKKDIHKNLDIQNDNLLRLPRSIQMSVDVDNFVNLEYLYDVAGSKLRKTIKNTSGAILFQEDYLGGITYTNGKINYVTTDEGIAYKQNNQYHYEYFIADHQGSVRASFGNLPGRYVYSATLEPQNANRENQDFAIKPQVLSNEENNTPVGTTSAKLNAVAGNMVGPATVIDVALGDKVSMEAWAKYTSTTWGSTNLTGIGAAVINVLTQNGFSLSSEQSNNLSNALNGSGTGLYGNNASTTEPSAYLQYVFFSNSHVFQNAGFAGVTSLHHDKFNKLELDFTAPSDGWLYVFVANESNANQNVWFDDIRIVHEQNATSFKVTQVNEYYPFGLPTANTWRRPGYVSPGMMYQGLFASYDSIVGQYEFLSRTYDPALGRFMQVDPAGQFHNPYLGMGNVPNYAIDPDGEFVWIIPQIGWSKKGGLSAGLSVVVGIHGIVSAQVGGGFNFKANEGYGYAGATASFNTVYMSYSPSGGWNTGYTAGTSIYSGLPVSTNFLTVGVNYNITHGQWSGNLSSWNVDQTGWTFNPSVNVMVYPEQTTNFLRGKKFRSNDAVLADFVAASDNKGALDYFGFKGTYGGEGMSSTFRDKKTRESGIIYRDDAFNSYGDMLAVYKKESFHLRRLRNGGWELGDTDNFASARQPEERLGLIHQYKNSGFYRKVPEFLSRIARVEGLIDMYNPPSIGRTDGLYNSYYHYTTFQPKWWHRIYRIPRIY